MDPTEEINTMVLEEKLYIKLENFYKRKPFITMINTFNALIIYAWYAFDMYYFYQYYTELHWMLIVCLYTEGVYCLFLTLYFVTSAVLKKNMVRLMLLGLYGIIQGVISFCLFVEYILILPTLLITRKLFLRVNFNLVILNLAVNVYSFIFLVLYGMYMKRHETAVWLTNPLFKILGRRADLLEFYRPM